MRAGEESAEAVVAMKAVKAAGAKGRRTNRRRSIDEPSGVLRGVLRNSPERQLRQLPELAGGGGGGGSAVEAERVEASSVR